MKPSASRKATLNLPLGNPDEDLQFISFSRGTQTEQDLTEELYLAYKNSYNELAVVHGELMVKYDKAKEKFETAKLALEEQKHRSNTLPVMYQTQFYRLLAEHRELQKKMDDMKEAMRDFF